MNESYRKIAIDSYKAVEDFLSRSGRRYHAANADVENHKLLLECINEIPLFIVEENLKRSMITANAIKSRESFWFIESQAIDSAEELLLDLNINKSLAELINNVSVTEDYKLKAENIYFFGFEEDNEIHSGLFRNRQIDIINVFPDNKRVDFRLSINSEHQLWNCIKGINRYTGLDRDIYIQKGNLNIFNANGFTGMQSKLGKFLFLGSSFSSLLNKKFEAHIENSHQSDFNTIIERIIRVFINLSREIIDRQNAENLIDGLFIIDRNDAYDRDEILRSKKVFELYFDRDELVRAATDTKWRILDLDKWSNYFKKSRQSYYNE